MEWRHALTPPLQLRTRACGFSCCGKWAWAVQADGSLLSYNVRTGRRVALQKGGGEPADAGLTECGVTVNRPRMLLLRSLRRYGRRGEVAVCALPSLQPLAVLTGLPGVVTSLVPYSSTPTALVFAAGTEGGEVLRICVAWPPSSRVALQELQAEGGVDGYYVLQPQEPSDQQDDAVSCLLPLPDCLAQAHTVETGGAVDGALLLVTHRSGTVKLLRNATCVAQVSLHTGLPITHIAAATPSSASAGRCIVAAVCGGGPMQRLSRPLVRLLRVGEGELEALPEAAAAPLHAILSPSASSSTTSTAALVADDGCSFRALATSPVAAAPHLLLLVCEVAAAAKGTLQLKIVLMDANTSNLSWRYLPTNPCSSCA